MLFLPSHLPTAHVRRPPPPEGGRVITRGVVKIESCLFLSTSTEGHGPILGGDRDHPRGSQRQSHTRITFFLPRFDLAFH